jgi:hypothetical protein
MVQRPPEDRAAAGKERVESIRFVLIVATTLDCHPKPGAKSGSHTRRAPPPEHAGRPAEKATVRPERDATHPFPSGRIDCTGFAGQLTRVQCADFSTQAIRVVAGAAPAAET